MMRYVAVICIALILGVSTFEVSAHGVIGQQRQMPVLRGQVRDELGGAIVRAKVTATDISGAEKIRLTDNSGFVTFDQLPSGSYIIRVEAAGFANYVSDPLSIREGSQEFFDVRLTVMLKDELIITDDRALSVAPENNADAVVLRGRAIDVLPDNPEALAAALQGLAAATGGAGIPSSGQIIVDGFPQGTLPPKDAIREIRISQNPYAAEFERPGRGRIEIFTKSGAGSFHGATYFSLNDESLNSRNPFALTRAPFQMRQYGGNFSTGLPGGWASLFGSLSRTETDGNSLINAVVLDSGLNVVRLNHWIASPSRVTMFNPRVDVRINSRNTIATRYQFSQAEARNVGVGEFSLPSRGYNSSATDHTIQVTETAILSKSAINETGFQYHHTGRGTDADNSTATLRVLESFVGGGAEIGRSSTETDRFSLHNFTTLIRGRHTYRFGGRLRSVHTRSVSPRNFGGTYVFGGGPGPRLDSQFNVQRSPDGQPLLAEISSIERYRRTLELQARGVPPEVIRALGGGATQFSISGGDPEASVSQVDVGVFVQDDYRLRSNLNMSFGLRYETQTNISSNFNFGPRLGVSWSPRNASNKPLAVIRFGIGVFYERFSESFTLQTRRYDGVTQQQFVVSEPAILNLFPAVPPVAILSAFAVPQTIRRVSDTLSAPYTVQTSLGIERQLPRNFNLAVSFSQSRTVHAFRSRNVTAPAPLSALQVTTSPVRNTYEYESSGVFDQRYLSINVSKNFTNNLSFYSTYLLGQARSDTDGADSFPANSYDLRAEYGRAAYDLRHQFYFGGTFTAPGEIIITPYVTAHSGLPFDITTGRDENLDSLFTDRPTFALDPTSPSATMTRFGILDPKLSPGMSVIPRNYGQGPGYFILNLYLAKTFSLRSLPELWNGKPNVVRSGQSGDSSFKITLSAQVLNLLNRTNLGSPIGNLTSPLFGSSVWNVGDYGFGGGTPAGNRRIEFQIRFMF